MATSLGKELHKVRQLRGLSLKAVADPAGVSATYLQKLERGQVKSPSPHRLRRLAQVLGIEYGALFSLAGYGASSGQPISPSGVGATPFAIPTTTKGSLLRQAFQSEDEISDDELEQLVAYLQFLRQRKPQDEG